jgi:pyruvate dehydrogenase E1 component
VHNKVMIPFYIFYSMFGFQRIGDLAWAAGDSRARGFLIGATAGRTTLNGEGLQHEDGHSHILANTIPNCISYDPTYSYELAIIINDGLKRMFENKESVFYYITVMNENYEHPELKKGAEEGIIKGMYLLQEASKEKEIKHRVQLLGSGTILLEVLEAAKLLAEDFQVGADIWSVTSFNQLTREARDIERWNSFHPNEKPKEAYVTSCLKDTKGPVIAATDYIRQYSDQIRGFIGQKKYITLGTDGFGRSDSRKELRYFFEVDRYYIAYTALKALADEGSIPIEKLLAAREKYRINPDKPNPLLC